jgi:hypothetical protein
MMTILNILEDGTVYPQISEHDLIVKIEAGKISVGRFCKNDFMAREERFLCEPDNALNLKADVLAYMVAKRPDLIINNELVFVLCPQTISAKANWEKLQVA